MHSTDIQWALNYASDIVLGTEGIIKDSETQSSPQKFTVYPGKQLFILSLLRILSTLLNGTGLAKTSYHKKGKLLTHK